MAKLSPGAMAHGRRHCTAHSGATMLGVAMKHFASADTFLDVSDWNFRMGRPLANEAFLRALLQHGHFERYTFFAPDMAAAHAWQKKLISLVGDATTRQRAQVQPHLALRAAAAREPYQVFHQGDFTYFMPHLCELRRSLAQARWPLCGVTHSLDSLQMRFLQLSLCGMAACDAIVCTSQAAQTLVRAKLAEVSAGLGQPASAPVMTPVIPLGLADEAFVAPDSDAQAARRAARTALRLPPEATVLLSVGRLSLRGKADWAPIFEMLHDMKREGALDQVVWVIAGGSAPEGLALLQTLVARHELQQQVRLLPNFAPAVRPRLYAAADIYVSLVDNLQETFGLSVIEAMAAGLPVVASDYSGYRDSVVHEQTGLLVPSYNLPEAPSAMRHTLGLLDPAMVRLLAAQMTAVSLSHARQALTALIDNPELRARLATAGRRRAERYRYAAVIAAYEALWEEQASMAQAQPWQQMPAALAPLSADLRAYAGYATTTLDAQSMLRMGPRAKALLRDPNAASRYEDILPLLDLKVERALLEAVRRGRTSVHNLRSLGRQAGAQSNGDVDFQLGWLLKHGALQLAQMGGGR
ncbi:MAG: glycosyltransferase [Deltaproteobacteria bacterium]|nr:MAG: glycosyltransferase [Deltaproteobacteria bacterium]